MRLPLYTTILALITLSTTLALTPKERELVQGLTGINKDLRAQITQNEAAISQKDTDYLFLQQKNDSLTVKLDATIKLATTQQADLTLQQQLLKDQEAALDKAEKDRDAAKAVAAKKTIEAHRNATERDICLLVAAVFGTVLVMTYSSYIISFICRLWPAAAPFGIGLEIGIAILSFTALYGAGRGFLAIVASRL